MMVYAYDHSGPLPDTRTAAELDIARERAIARWMAAHARYVIDSTEAKWDILEIDMEKRRRSYQEATTVRFTNPPTLKPAPLPVRPHVQNSIPLERDRERRNGRMQLEGLDG